MHVLVECVGEKQRPRAQLLRLVLQHEVGTDAAHTRTYTRRTHKSTLFISSPWTYQSHVHCACSTGIPVTSTKRSKNHTFQRPYTRTWTRPAVRKWGSHYDVRHVCLPAYTCRVPMLCIAKSARTVCVLPAGSLYMSRCAPIIKECNVFCMKFAYRICTACALSACVSVRTYR